MDLTEIITDWSTGSGRAGLSVMYFDTSIIDETTTRSELADFWGTIDAYLDSNTRWTIRTTGRVVDSSTGALVGEWTEPTLRTAFGSVSGAAVADLAQVLVRWNTGVVVRGRFLKGRTFIPGYASSLQAEGQVGSVQQAAIASAGANLLAGANLQVWQRPFAGSADPVRPAYSGSSARAETASVWAEFASQRNRRG